MKKYKTLAEELDKLLSDQMQLEEMTRVAPRDSGLDQHIWISSKGNAKHEARIKVSNIKGKFASDDNFSISVENEPSHKAGTTKIKPEDYQKIKDWIRLNKDHLNKVWNSDTMDSRDHLDGLSKI